VRSGGRSRPSELDFWWRLGVILVGPAFRLMFRIRFLGLERVPRTGAAILAANHVSVFDGIVLGLASARRGRTVRFLAAHEWFENRWVGWALRLFRQIPIRRGEGDAGALDEAAATLRSGALAGIFPEGHVTDGSGLERGRTGVARIALASEAPVIPVGIWGTQVRYPRTGFTLRRPLRPDLAVSFGRPIEPRGDPGSVDDVQAFTDLVMEGIGGQLAEARAHAEGRRA